MAQGHLDPLRAWSVGGERSLGSLVQIGAPQLPIRKMFSYAVDLI